MYRNFFYNTCNCNRCNVNCTKEKSPFFNYSSNEKDCCTSNEQKCKKCECTYICQGATGPQGPQGETGPVGPAGADGTAATITVGTTTTLPPGSNATVTNVGTPTNAVLNFGIPTGENSATIDSGNFISRTTATYTAANSIIGLPITLNSEGITISPNGIISISKEGRYLINYGIKSTTIDNIVGLYINGTNNTNTNINTLISDLNPSSSVILDLNANDVITLGAVNADETLPLTLEDNTINAFVTLISLD